MNSFAAIVLSAGIIVWASSGQPLKSASIPSPLSAYSKTWDDPQYRSCNTAASVTYMNDAEKNVIYILNMARKNPVLFAHTVVKQYPEKRNRYYLQNSTYYASLPESMKKMKPVNLLQPDSFCYVSANCHATSSGLKGYVGHTRQSSEVFPGSMLNAASMAIVIRLTLLWRC